MTYFNKHFWPNIWAQKWQPKDPSEVDDGALFGVEVLDVEVLVRELVAEGEEFDVEGSVHGGVRDGSMDAGKIISLPY
jgi:hypothetical protein